MYSNSDFIKFQRSRYKNSHRVKEDRIIEEIIKKNKFIDNGYFNLISKKRKIQLKAEANTIPLTAFLYDKKGKRGIEPGAKAPGSL